MYSDDLAKVYAPRLLATVQTPGWKDMVDVIATKILLQQEVALADEPDELKYHRGYIAGLRAALQAPVEVIEFARNESGEKKEARRRATAAGEPTLS